MNTVVICCRNNCERCSPTVTATGLFVIPVGELWLVPERRPGDPHRVLGQAARDVVCPSLTVQRQLGARGPAGHDTAQPQIDLWRSPLVHNHRLAGFGADGRWQVNKLTSAAAAKDRLRADSAAMVVIGHGRPVPGLGHHLVDSGEWLLPVDLIGARPPRRLAMIACWGAAIPGRGPTDPLSLATLALAAGSAEILATVGELADSDAAALYVQRVLAEMADRPLCEALYAATRWILHDDGVRSGRIHHWAPLVPFGTLY